MKEKKTALILGGGIAGMAAAIRLNQSGWNVKIFEKITARDRLGHGFILLENGLESLDKLGLGDAINSSGSEITEFKLYSSSGDPIYNTPMGRSKGFRRADFIRILEENLPPQSVQYGKRFTGFVSSPDGQASAAQFDDGSIIKADLFLASDGIQSAVRRNLFPASSLTEVRVKELVSHLKNPELAHWVGKKFIKYQRPSGGLALGIVPAGDDQIIWYIQFDAQEFPLNEPTSLAKKAFVEKHFKGWPDPISRLIQFTDFEMSHTWMTTDLDPLPALHSQNIALIGDAGHAFLPFTSQGVNAALSDALVLGELLDHHEIQEALPLYTKLRLPEIAKTVEGGRTLRERFLKPELFKDDKNSIVPLVK